MRKYVQHLGDQAADGLKFLHAKAARGASGRAEPDAGSHRRFFGVERNFVLVASDVRATQRFLRDLATEALRPEIDEDQMRVGATGDDGKAVAAQGFRQCLGVLDDILHVEFVVGRKRLAEGDRLRRNRMHQGTALQARKHGGVDFPRQLLVVGEHQAAARAAERLVCRRSDDVSVGERAWMRAAGDESGEMRHVNHEYGADRIRDFAEAREINHARIGGAAGDDDFRLCVVRERLDFVIVDALIVAPHAIGDRLEPLARHVHGRAVGKMAAGGEVEPQIGIARLHGGHKSGLVRLTAGMRLHIGEAAIEQFFRAVDGKLLDHVDPLATTVIALARITLGVFVGEHRALRFQHGA